MSTCETINLIRFGFGVMRYDFDALRGDAMQCEAVCAGEEETDREREKRFLWLEFLVGSTMPWTCRAVLLQHPACRRATENILPIHL